MMEYEKRSIDPKNSYESEHAIGSSFFYHVQLDRLPSLIELARIFFFSTQYIWRVNDR